MLTNPALPFKDQEVLSKEDYLYFSRYIKDFMSQKQKNICADLGEGETTYKNGYLNIELDKGRAMYYFSNNDFDEKCKEIVNKIIEKAHEIDPKVSIRNIVYSLYSNDYGIPCLFPHMDDVDPNEPCSFIIDYQLDSNVNWKIGTDGDYFDMEPNSSLAIDVIRKSHYREIKLFEDDEYVEMIFFYFSNGSYDDYLPDKEEQFNGYSKILEEFNKPSDFHEKRKLLQSEIFKKVIKKNNLPEDTKEIDSETLWYLIKKFHGCPSVVVDKCLDNHKLCEQRRKILFYFSKNNIYK